MFGPKYMPNLFFFRLCHICNSLINGTLIYETVTLKWIALSKCTRFISPHIMHFKTCIVFRIVSTVWPVIDRGPWGLLRKASPEYSRITVVGRSRSQIKVKFILVIDHDELCIHTEFRLPIPSPSHLLVKKVVLGSLRFLRNYSLDWLENYMSK